MTEIQRHVFAAMDPGRFYLPSEAQACTAHVSRMIYSRQSVAIALGLMASAGLIVRECIGTTRIYQRKAEV